MVYWRGPLGIFLMVAGLLLFFAGGLKYIPDGQLLGIFGGALVFAVGAWFVLVAVVRENTPAH